MDAARLIALLDEERRAGFSAFSGTSVDATLVLQDEWITRALAAVIPAGAPVADVDIHSQPGQKLRVGLRVPRVTFLPRIELALEIAGQPKLPERPVIDLRLSRAGGLMAFAGSALRFFEALPPGIRVAGELIQVNVFELMAARGQGDLARYLEELHIETDQGRVRVRLRARMS